MPLSFVPKLLRWHSLFRKENTTLQQLVLWIFIALAFVLFEEYPRYFSQAEAACYLLQQLAIMIIISNIHCYLILPFFKQHKFALGALFYVLLFPVLSYMLPYFPAPVEIDLVQG